MRRVPLNFFQRPQGHVSLADNQLLALLLMAGGATGISRAQSQTEAARSKIMRTILDTTD